MVSAAADAWPLASRSTILDVNVEPDASGEDGASWWRAAAIARRLCAVGRDAAERAGMSNRIDKAWFALTGTVNER
jgi:hypothetical protein